MISVDKKARVVEQSATLDEMEYFIDNSNVQHICAMLRNMYSNSVRACIREYSANAIDAHMQCGKQDTPIDITVPSSLAPVFKVRDFGPGLSVEDSKRLLCGFGSSGDHKRTSNSYVGGFGIGAKVGFAVASAFTYTIWHGGVKRIWSNYLDDFDASKASLLSESPSDEPTGIEVSVPVGADRVKEFITELQTAFMWYGVKPNMLGAEIAQEEAPPAVVGDTLHVLHNNKDTAVPFVLVQEQERRSYGSNEHPRVIMGNIEYPIELSLTTTGMDYNSLSVKNKKLLNTLVIHAPIGLLQLAPSRESLQYSQSTKNLLNKILTKILTPGYILGLFKAKGGKATALKEAYQEMQYYVSLLGDDLGTCLKELYPKYACYVTPSLFGKKQHDFSLFQKTPIIGGSTAIRDSGVPTAGVYLSLEPKSWFSGSGTEHIHRWCVTDRGFPNADLLTAAVSSVHAVAVSTEQYEALCTSDGVISAANKLSLLRKLMVHLSKGDPEAWKPETGSAYLRYAQNAYASPLGLVIMVCDDVSKLKKSVTWTAVREGIIPEIPYETFMAYDTTGVETDVAVYVKPRSTSYQRNGSTNRTKIVQHSRKFSKLTTESRGYNGKNSDSWESLLAKDVDSELGYAVPMDAFVCCSARGTGLAGTDAVLSQDVSDMKFLQRLLYSKHLVKEVFLDKPIIGIRIREYKDTIASYKFKSVWQRLKIYFSDYMTAHKLETEHLCALALLDVGIKTTSSTPGLMFPESAKLIQLVYNRVLKGADSTHRLWDAASKWAPYYNWADTVIKSNDPVHVAFREMFVLCHNHWVGNTRGGVEEHLPFVRTAADLVHWQNLSSATSCGSASRISDIWIDESKFSALNFPQGNAIIDPYVKYPGLSAFLPQHACYRSYGKVDTQSAQFMWNVVVRSDVGNPKRVSEPPTGLVDHLMEYINNVSPIVKEV